MSSPRCETHSLLDVCRCAICGARWCVVCHGSKECPACRDLDYTNATPLGVWTDDEERERERMERRQRGDP